MRLVELKQIPSRNNNTLRCAYFSFFSSKMIVFKFQPNDSNNNKENLKKAFETIGRPDQLA